MGRTLPEMKCGLCGREIDPLGAFFRAGGEFLPAKDPLRPLSDAPMHWPCYAAWPERPRFAKRFVDGWVAANRKNPFWWTVFRDEAVYVSVNPQPPVEAASVRLCTVGTDIRVPLPRWKAWLANPREVTPDLQELETEVLGAVLPALRSRFPDDHAVIDAIDPAEKPRR